jgi:hypothetical protein
LVDSAQGSNALGFFIRAAAAESALAPRVLTYHPAPQKSKPAGDADGWSATQLIEANR